jgi:hypothetical protein
MTDSNEGDAMAPSNFSAQFVLDQIKEIKNDIRQEIRDLKKDVKDEIEKVDERLSGNDGVMERITALEVKVEELFDKEMTPPISVAIPSKTSYKQTAIAAGSGGGVLLVLQQLLEVAKDLVK